MDAVIRNSRQKRPRSLGRIRPPSPLALHSKTSPRRGYSVDIEATTLANPEYRRVLKTYPGSMQLVAMSVPPGGEIPWEQHADSSQFIRFEMGHGLVRMKGTKVGQVREEHEVRDGDAVIVPPGRWHHVRNLSTSESLKLYTVYCPPVHHEEK